MRPCLEKNQSQKGAGGVAQGVGPEFKPQHCKKKKEKAAGKILKTLCLMLARLYHLSHTPSI
jgi:hypothetical protein